MNAPLRASLGPSVRAQGGVGVAQPVNCVFEQPCRIAARSVEAHPRITIIDHSRKLLSRDVRASGQRGRRNWQAPMIRCNGSSMNRANTPQIERFLRIQGRLPIIGVLPDKSNRFDRDAVLRAISANRAATTPVPDPPRSFHLSNLGATCRSKHSSQTWTIAS